MAREMGEDGATRHCDKIQDKTGVELKVCTQLRSKKEEREVSEYLEKRQKVSYFEQYANSMCQEAAQKGNVASAEMWIRKLAGAGKVPEMQSFNSVLQAMISSGASEHAEEMFQNALYPRLHPELGGIQPDAVSYNTMVQAFCATEDLPRAEKYAADAMGAGLQLNQTTFTLLAGACLNQGEVRRAHNWMENMVGAGFAKPSRNLMRRLVLGLADAGSVNSVERWLAHMAGRGITLDAEALAHVRAACPMDVLPCQLSGQSPHVSPPQACPAELKGEKASNPEEVRPKRDAHVFLPPRSFLPTAARWPPKLRAEVQEEATKKLSSSLKAQFLTTSSEGCANLEQDDLGHSPRTPRRRYFGAHNQYLQFSRVAAATMPPKPGVTAPTIGDPQWHPYWLDSGLPPAHLQRLQYGGL